jgi:hypothetical protein
LHEPVFEAGVEGEGVRAGEEGARLKEGAIVASLGVGNDLSRVSSKAQALADQLIETELLWTGDLDGSVDGLADSCACNRAGDPSIPVLSRPQAVGLQPRQLGPLASPPPPEWTVGTTVRRPSVVLVRAVPVLPRPS